MRWDSAFSGLSPRKRRVVLRARVLLRLGEHRRDIVRWTFAVALLGLVALLLAAPPGGWTMDLVSRDLGGLVFILGVLTVLWIVLVSPHPLCLTEKGIAKWPFVCLVWDELEYYAILDIGIDRPVRTLQLLSKRSTLPLLPPHTGLRLSDEAVRRIRQIMAEKGVPEHPD